MLYIEVPDMNDSLSSIEIEEKTYFLRFTYNAKQDYWSFGMYDEEKKAIFTGVKIVPNFPLTYPINLDALPHGTFSAKSTNENIGRNDFVEGTAEFIYVPYG